MLSRILKTELRIENLSIQNHHIFCKRKYSIARGDRLWKWKGPDYLGIWTNNASLNSKFLKTVRSTNRQYQYHNHQTHFKLLKSMVHTEPNDPVRAIPLPLKFAFELVHCIVILFTLSFTFLWVLPKDPDEPYMSEQPVTTEFIPTEYDIDMLNGKLKQFYAHPGRGMDLNSDDLNTFFVSLPSTEPIRPYLNFLPVTEESETSASLPVKVSLPLQAGQYFNCILYYKLVQVDDRWTTELERVKPLYSDTELSSETIQFFHRDFLNPNFFKLDPELKKLLSYLEAVHINRFGLLLNILKVPKKKVELTDEEVEPYESVFKTPLFWVDEFPLANKVPRKSIGYSLLFDNEKFERI